MTVSTNDIAIVGYACRLPGASDPDAFWSLLSRGDCVISEVRPDRWSKQRFGHPDRNVIGRSYTWAAGQIDDVWGFDPTFFGISPREAVQMDPQQRLMLQVVWEALEHGGIVPSSLAGSETGVYVGVSGTDYSHTLIVDPPAGDMQSMTGNTLSIVSNRISYIFDLRGPSFSVDTACSSSVVAMHEALEALRAGRIDTAIVGGVNLLLSPFAFIGFSRASMLSPTGLCRAFDAAGDGYVRSEGAVALVLRTVGAARAAGNTIRSIVAASGINSDGRTAGLSLPSSTQQAALLAAVYDRFGIDPESLAFVEAHGTGTRVGDPAEANALGEVLGRRRQSPLPVGSVKTNIGHLEPASGLAGVLKAQMALERRLLPASLHFETPNPDIAFDELNIRVASQPIAFGPSLTPYHAGINSFGFGGANAHVVLREAPEIAAPATITRPARQAPLVVSAQSKDALVALAASYRDRLAATDDRDAITVARAAAWHRERLDHRFVALGNSREEIIAALDAFIADENRPAPARSGQKSASVAFVYAGNGSQWAGMGRAAYQTDSAFRSAFEAVNRLFMRVAGWSLVTTLFSEDLDTDIERTEVAQPLLFATQVALTEALARRGLRPQAVAGHSVGEVAAAYAAGSLSMEQAVYLIHVRSTHQEVTRHLGGMAALLVPADSAREALADPAFAGIEIAADNSPRSVTLSGTTDLLDAFGKAARKKRWAMRKLRLDYPFHCALIEPIREALTFSLGSLKPKPTTIPFVSTVTGAEITGRELNADYWWRNVRQPVLFRTAIEQIATLGARVFVEIGPKPVLQTYVTDTLDASGHVAATLATLDESDAVGDDIVGAIVARVLTAGGAIDDARFFGEAPAGPVALPSYPWQNQPYRFTGTVEGVDLFGTNGDHPLLGARARADGGPFFANIDPATLPWLADHKVENSTVFPAAGFVEMALAAARVVLGDGPIELLDFDILRPMVLDDGVRETRVEVDAGAQLVEISSRPRLSEEAWSLHARCRIARPPATIAAVGAESPATAVLGKPALYALTRRFGLNYGDAFQRADEVRATADGRVTVALSPDQAALVGDDAYALHPTLLDAAFHGLFVLIDRLAPADGGTSFLPVRLGEVRLYAAGRTPASAIVDVVRSSPRSVEAVVTLIEADGTVIARASGVRFKAVPLVRAEDPDGFAFRLSTVRLADAADPAMLPAAWSTPAERAEALGIAAAEAAGDADPDEAALLIDAAARGTVADALRPLAGEDGVLDPAALAASGTVHAAALPLLYRMIDALEEFGVVEADGERWRFAEDAALPPPATMIATLLADHPRRIAEVAALVRVAGRLPALLSGGLLGEGEALLGAAAAEHLELASVGARARLDALAAMTADAACAWPADAPLRVLVLGTGAGEIVRAVAGAVARLDRLAVSDADRTRTERLRFALSDLGRAEVVDLDGFGPADRFEIVVAAAAFGRPDGQAALSAARRLLAPGGLLVAAERAPSLVADLVDGTAAAWWRGSLEPSLPVGPLDTAERWATRLAAAGFDAVTARAATAGEAEAVLLFARGPAAEPAAAPAHLTDPALVVSAGASVTHPVADALCALLSEHRRPVRLAVGRVDETGARLEALDAGSDSDLDALLAGAAVKDLVLLADTRHPDPMQATSEAIALIHAILNGAMRPPARLWMVLPGGSGAATSRPHDPVAAALWGLGRVLMNEYPDVETRLVDLGAAFAPSEAAGRIAALLDAPGDEREILLDLNGRAALRVIPGPPLVAPAERARAGALRGEVLAIERQGSLDGIGWHAFARPELSGDQVEIEVVATGLNFRDVMWAMGLLPEEALEDGFAGATLGMECSGRISRVGPDTKRFRVGDPVITFAPACFASHVTVSEIAVAPVPATVDLEAAATIPVTFITAYYALVELARIEEGETVLIHGGAGGVGLAALQIAVWRGARVIATAGSADRRTLLSMLGADAVLDSRSLRFRDEVLRLTGGEGVDVVLNSLSGEAMERSIDVLKPFGRFVELGKRDFYANTRIGLRPFRQNLSYFGVDADQLLTRRPALGRRLFAELVARFEEKAFSALPYRIYPAERISDAFRLMQQSGHIGKVLVRPPVVTGTANGRRTEIRADATYLLVGGLGGFGVETARLLVERGARHLVLASRSGTVSDTAAPVVAAMRAKGAEVRIAAADAARREDVNRLIAMIDAEMPPLKGVLHTAMVIDDALFAKLDRTRIDAVMAPKIAGAHNLDEATREHELDLFVLYSSATTLIGNPGQAAYVAANAYLEGLARSRRAEGLPAIAVAWGAIADAGYLARNADVSAMLGVRMGKQSLAVRTALAGLDLILDADPADPVIAYARMDWAAARRELPIMATPLAAIVARGIVENAAADAGDGEIGAMIRDLEPAQAMKLVADILAGEVSRILRLPAEEIEITRPLTEIGMDSLMALELRMAAEQRLGVDIPLLSLANGAALGDIARKVVERLQGASERPMSAEADNLAALHVDNETDEDVATVMGAIEARSTEMKRLI
ncbi:type I polyketide synthase [Methylobrevis albus]|uniref:SDR family NAD(P)-dependent oxidoreductase n=1 Tax=Methylobrevis albus TaxID=2793297 RepID=A0A931MYD5_9HYPH|nr:type I polyketide synthase [Methylobrevis albus]MBH0236606.1 SDR family NAD(P)-dependent oxidoreductase [Methylobrevis albus]